MKDFVAPLVSTVQGMGGEFRQTKDMVERMKVEQGAITRKVGGGDEGWGDWGGGEGYCEEGSGECSGWKECLHDPSARCKEHHCPVEHPVTHPSRETK